MKVKSGIKVGMMLSSLVLSFGCFVGCNSDEPASTTAAKPAAGDTAKPPAAKPDDAKPK